MAISFAGNTAGSAINGGTVTLTISATAAVAGNYVVVTYCTAGTAVTHSVRSSIGAGDPYTQIMATSSSSAGTLLMSIWARKLSSTPIVQAVCIGSAGSTSVTCAALMSFVDTSLNPQLDTAVVSTRGSGTTPDSPSLTVTASNDMCISCVSAGIQDTTITSPTSFLNQTSTANIDTSVATVAMANLTLASTAAINPASWTGFTTSVWVSATVAIRAGSTALTVMPEYADENVVQMRTPIAVIPY